jgi:hypothetical protein
MLCLRCAWLSAGVVERVDLYLDSGTLLRASSPASRNSQSCCGVFMPLGRRHAIPQMAMGLGGLPVAVAALVAWPLVAA